MNLVRPMVFSTEPNSVIPTRKYARQESVDKAMEVLNELFSIVTPATITRSYVSRPGGRIVKYTYVRPGLGMVR